MQGGCAIYLQTPRLLMFLVLLIKSTVSYHHDLSDSPMLQSDYFFPDPDDSPLSPFFASAVAK
jgi:hypothetical protein